MNNIDIILTMYLRCSYGNNWIDSEIMYFPPSFHFKKGLAKFTIEVRLIRGFRQKGAFSALSRGASNTRMRLIPEYIR